MYKALNDILRGNEFETVERFEIPGRSAKFAETPRFLFDSRIGVYLSRLSKQTRSTESGLWAHQAHALDMLGRGENVVISTGTASGKSLVFQAITLHKMLRDPDTRALIFYPQKALLADQIRNWQQVLHDLNLDAEMIGRIDGSVSVPDREKKLEQSKIVAMTPDVCQAWLMSRLAMPTIRNFVGALSTIVMDEAHTLEGVFGSNFAFLIRRLIAARSHILRATANSTVTPPQLIASTATIENPGEHLNLLTGSNFAVVDHLMDGSPQHERFIAHVACPENDEFTIATNLQERVLAQRTDGIFITFVDSRKGAETLAIATKDEDVLPYRAGYLEIDRQEIERRLRSGDLRGVISTSALELGIDIPHLRIGFNIGIPPTRKAYRQRHGRVGRREPGAFVVIAPKGEFQRYGTSLHEYHKMSVEPSYLYLDNRFMQFAHGRCLVDELEALQAPTTLPARVGWPTGFKDAYAAARPGGDRPIEFDPIAELGGDQPQYSYPLRNIGEMIFGLKLYKNADNFGTLNYLQALRECYPGAVYFHMGKPHGVVAWYIRGADSFILLKPSAPGRTTRPRIRTWINVRLDSMALLDNHLLRGKNGFLTECEMQVSEHVVGYVDERSGNFHDYRDLQRRNPNMQPRSRRFRTSGIVLCINQNWFKQNETKHVIADRIREVFVHEYSILPQDVDSAATRVIVQSPEGEREKGGCIALFDQTHGSLRLTERLFCNFEHILERLSKAATDQFTKDWVGKIRAEFAEFSKEPFHLTGGDVSTPIVEKYIQVFAPKSRVLYRKQGQVSEEVLIIEPALFEEQLFYKVKFFPKFGQQAARQFISASFIEPGVPGDWVYVWWNQETQEYEDPPEDE